MDWQTIAVERLKSYELRRRALETLPEQIKLLELEYESIRTARLDGMPSGGEDRREAAMVGNIARRDELERARALASKEVALTELALDALDGRERRVLEEFYIHRRRDHVSRLCEELCVEKSRLYQMKDQALGKFTEACYPVPRL